MDASKRRRSDRAGARPTWASPGPGRGVWHYVALLPCEASSDATTSRRFIQEIATWLKLPFLPGSPLPLQSHQRFPRRACHRRRTPKQPRVALVWP